MILRFFASTLRRRWASGSADTIWCPGFASTALHVAAYLEAKATEWHCQLIEL